MDKRTELAAAQPDDVVAAIADALTYVPQIQMLRQTLRCSTDVNAVAVDVTADADVAAAASVVVWLWGIFTVLWTLMFVVDQKIGPEKMP